MRKICMCKCGSSKEGFLHVYMHVTCVDVVRARVLRAHRGLNVQINGVQVEGAIGIGYLYIYQHV